VRLSVSGLKGVGGDPCLIIQVANFFSELLQAGTFEMYTCGEIRPLLVPVAQANLNVQTWVLVFPNIRRNGFRPSTIMCRFVKRHYVNECQSTVYSSCRLGGRRPIPAQFLVFFVLFALVVLLAHS